MNNFQNSLLQSFLLKLKSSKKRQVNGVDQPASFDSNQASIAKDLKKRTFNPRNYSLRSTLMSPSEQKFFKKLRAAIGESYDIYPQVNLDKIFRTKSQYSRHGFNAAKWAIDRRSIDFLITIRETQQPFIGIELDDFSHMREDRILRDKNVEALFQENGINLMRFNTSDDFLEEELRRLFQKRYGKS